MFDNVADMGSGIDCDYDCDSDCLVAILSLYYRAALVAQR